MGSIWMQKFLILISKNKKIGSLTTKQSKNKNKIKHKEICVGQLTKLFN